MQSKTANVNIEKLRSFKIMKHTKKNLVYDDTVDNYGKFRTGWKVYKGHKYYWFDFLTNLSGYRDKTFQIPVERIEEFLSVKDFIIHTNWDIEKPVWIGEPV